LRSQALPANGPFVESTYLAASPAIGVQADSLRTLLTDAADPMYGPAVRRSFLPRSPGHERERSMDARQFVSERNRQHIGHDGTVKRLL
jgi:hypothetical protein